MPSASHQVNKQDYAPPCYSGGEEDGQRSSAHPLQQLCFIPRAHNKPNCWPQQQRRSSHILHVFLLGLTTAKQEWLGGASTDPGTSWITAHFLICSQGLSSLSLSLPPQMATNNLPLLTSKVIWHVLKCVERKNPRWLP